MSLLIAMISLSSAMALSPGPVNMVIVSSGASYGIRRTFSFVTGATVGCTSLLLFLGLGFYKIIDLYPFILKYIAVLGSLFIMYMGYLRATAKPELNIEKQKLPTFVQGFLLQWLNPKAWLGCISGVSLFSVPNDGSVFLTFALVYFVICYVGLFGWSVLGDKVTIFLNNEFRLRAFNIFMGGLLFVTACFLLYSQFKTSY
jgi:threonine/homoserine/homoserine lactone efflux protein